MKKIILLLFVLLLLTAACRSFSDPQNDFANFTDETYPIPYVSLEELEASFDLSKLFPQFDIAETTINSKIYYKFSVKDSDVYALIDEGQTSLTIYNKEKSTSFPITNIFPTAIYSSAALIVEDITDDQNKELIYISSGGGTGALYSTCHIVNLSTLTEYPLDDNFKSAITSNIKIVPQKKINEEIILCEIILEDQQTFYGTVPISKEVELGHYQLVPANCSSYILIEWEPIGKSLEVSIGLTLADAIPGNYLCVAQGRLIFDEQSQSFVGEPCYDITIVNPHVWLPNKIL